jgi:hypothetical protein
MTKGIVVLAQNNYKVNYVDQAIVLALSLKLTNPNLPISIVTNERISKKDSVLFDKIIEIPWDDLSKVSDWKVENRWKVYHATPYDETIVMDTDMLVLENISTWWNFLKNYDLFFTSTVLTYRGEKVTSDYYRKAFVNNNLPNLYTGVYYFKKSDFAQEFFAQLEIVVKNWQDFYKIFLKNDCPNFISMDVCAAITAKILNCEYQIKNSKIIKPTFTHMKAKVQNWDLSPNNWQRNISAYFDDDCVLKIGNHRQHGIFHYTEKDFIENVNAKIKYRKKLNDN